MSIARVTEIVAASSKSFDDAIRMGIARADKTLDNITGAWVQDQELKLDGAEIKEYRVHLKITFVLND
ncbi:MAG TPA: dodecin family protein [Woeseiaceae bacterium]|nr:dodecin family protein [Woeseiaceae bacterium]